MGEYLKDMKGECYYTDIPICENKISNTAPRRKLECEINEGYFISPKLYAIKTKDGKEILRQE